MWDLSFPTRVWTLTPCIGRWSANHWMAKEVPWPSFICLFSHFLDFASAQNTWTLHIRSADPLYGNIEGGVGSSTYKSTKHPSPQLSMGFSRQEYAISFSRGSSQPRDWTHVSYVSCVAGGFFTCWATEEALPQCMDPPNCWAERKHPIQLLILWTKDPG